VQIDREIEAGGAKLPRERQIVAHPVPPAAVWHHENFVEVWVGPKNRGSVGLDEIGDPGIRKASAQRSNRGRREHDVANQPWPDQEDLHGKAISQQPSAISQQPSAISYEPSVAIGVRPADS
jgi:hypothetical protein